MQTTLSVTLHKSLRPLTDLGPLLSPNILPLLVCDPVVITQLIVIACGGVVEESERPIRAADWHGGTISPENRVTALDLLCWIACLHCHLPNRYLLIYYCTTTIIILNDPSVLSML